MKKLVVIAFGLLLLVLAACGGSGEEDKEESNNDDNGSADERKVTIEDMTGEKTIEGTPKKIVALEWSFAENLLALGVQPAGVAGKKDFHKWVNIDKDFDESVKDVGGRVEPNLEAISRLNPDLILAFKDRHGEYLDKLKEIAPVVTFDQHKAGTEKNYYDSMVNRFKTTAKIVDKEDKAEEVLNEMNTAIDEQKQRAEDAGLTDSKFVATQVFTTQNTPTIRMFMKNSMVSQVISKLGMENAYDPGEKEQYGFTTAGVEALQTFHNKDIQFLYIAQDDDNIFENQLKGNPVWEDLSFVKKGNTHKMPGSTWTFGGVLSAEVLAKQVVDSMVEE